MRIRLVDNINCNKEQVTNIKYSTFLFLIVSFMKDNKYVIIIELVNNLTKLHDNIRLPQSRNTAMASKNL